MKKTAIVGALLLLTSIVFAQKEKINIAVLNFYGPSKTEVQGREIRSSFLNLITDGPDYNNMAQIMRQFQDYAIEVFLRDQRFVMVERAQISRIQEDWSYRSRKNLSTVLPWSKVRAWGPIICCWEISPLKDIC